MSKLGFSKKDNYTRCKNSAIYSLAMREHSRLEISNKLRQKKYAEGVDIEVLIDELEQNNYLNEERFAESFVRYRASRGQGVMKITSELRQRGITQILISKAIESSEIDWFELALQQKEKKFGTGKAEDFKQKTKQMRFLSSRGFDHEMIRYATS